LRNTLLYYGAHTGRWSGRGFQPQNLPRPESRYEEEGVDIDALALAVRDGEHCTQADIEFLLRGVLTASKGNTLVCADFASIEARATAWAAGDEGALDVFRSERDPYMVAATAVFGVAYDDVTKAQRQVGKVCELALGYQGGPRAFASMAEVYGVDLSELDLEAIVYAWRELHSPIVSLWYRCESAFRRALERGSCSAGVFDFVLSDDGHAIACFLPSGRPLVYNGAKATPSSEEGKRPELSYLGEFRGKLVEKSLYGGKLVENAIQGLCRDLMSSALVRAEQQGLNPVLTVHDEIVCDVPAERAQTAYEALVREMTNTPSWAAGLPVHAKGWIGFRFRK
jgi:DNA polymerase